MVDFIAVISEIWRVTKKSWVKQEANVYWGNCIVDGSGTEYFENVSNCDINICDSV